MITNTIPKAIVKFRDGHEEESISTIIFRNDLFYVITSSGCYSPTNGFAIVSYSAIGEVDYSFDSCWIIDDNAEEIRLWFEEKRD